MVSHTGKRYQYNDNEIIALVQIMINELTKRRCFQRQTFSSLIELAVLCHIVALEQKYTIYIVCTLDYDDP